LYIFYAIFMYTSIILNFTAAGIYTWKMSRIFNRLEACFDVFGSLIVN